MTVDGIGKTDLTPSRMLNGSLDGLEPNRELKGLPTFDFEPNRLVIGMRNSDLGPSRSARGLTLSDFGPNRELRLGTFWVTPKRNL